MQALHIEPICSFGDSGRVRVGTNWILEVGYHLSILCECYYVPVGRGDRPYRARQPERQLAQKRLVRHPVSARVARLGKTEPDLPVQSTHQIVRVAGQVVQENHGLQPTSGHVEIVRRHCDFPHAVSTGFVDEQRLLVAAQRYAISEAQASGYGSDAFAGRVVLKDAAG